MTLWGEQVDTEIPHTEEQCLWALNGRKKENFTAMPLLITFAIQDCGSCHQSFRGFLGDQFGPVLPVSSRSTGSAQGKDITCLGSLPSQLYLSFLLCSQCPCVPISQLGMCVGHQEGQQENRGGAHQKGFHPTFPHLGYLRPHLEFSSPGVD